MFGAKADPERQRMQVIIHQALSADEFQQLIDGVKLESTGLEPGWAAAVDLRGMWINDPFINEQFEALQEALLDSQAGKIGTLLDSDPIKMHLWQAGTRTRSNLITQRFYDPEAWEHFLSQP